MDGGNNRVLPKAARSRALISTGYSLRMSGALVIKQRIPVRKRKSAWGSCRSPGKTPALLLCPEVFF
jgi:hypothetical protein